MVLYWYWNCIGIGVLHYDIVLYLYWSEMTSIGHLWVLANCVLYSLYCLHSVYMTAFVQYVQSFSFAFYFCLPQSSYNVLEYTRSFLSFHSPSKFPIWRIIHKWYLYEYIFKTHNFSNPWINKLCSGISLWICWWT
jgi:hypothetical protein